MRIWFLFIALCCVVGSASCQRKQRETIELKCRLYIEDFEVNPFGVDEMYLTDSLSFRIFVGKYDVEHESISCVCKENDVMIYRRKQDENGVWKRTDSFFLPRADLTANKIDSTQPLFKFK